MQILFINGSPYSGITLLKKTLRFLGVEGDGSSNEENSSLDEDARVISAQFLSELGISTAKSGHYPNDWHKSPAAIMAAKNLKTLIAAHMSRGLVVIGDPAVCRAMPLWLKIIDELNIPAKFIHILRHPWEAAQAIHYYENIQLEDAYRCWLSFYQTAEDSALAGLHVTVSFEDLLNNPINTLKYISGNIKVDYNCDLNHYYPLGLSLLINAKNRRFYSENMSVADMRLYKVFTNLYLKKLKPESKLVWLASYPRSGNTLLRIILNYNFGLKSYSLYNDTYDIGSLPEVAEIVGHRDMDWSFLSKTAERMESSEYYRFDHLRYDSAALTPVKTHGLWNEGFSPDKAIYIYRDGRAALRSYASYLSKFANGSAESSVEDILNTLLCREAMSPNDGDVWDKHVDAWNKNVTSWQQHPEDKLLYLKFEDYVGNFEELVKIVGEFLGRTPLRYDVPSFRLLNAINADFFRKGQKKSWGDLLDKTKNDLFWFVNYEVMDSLGYSSDRSPVGDILLSNICDSNKKENIFNTEEFSPATLDQTLMECLKLVLNNPNKYSLIQYESLISKLDKSITELKSFINTSERQKYDYKWRTIWHNLIHKFSSCPESESVKDAAEIREVNNNGNSEKMNGDFGTVRSVDFISGDGAKFNIELPDPALINSIFLFGIHKSGSTLLADIFTDVFKITGIPFINYPGELFAKGYNIRETKPLSTLFEQNGYAYLGFRFPWQIRESGIDLKKTKNILLVRDPRDALVSAYYSIVSSHVSLGAGLHDIYEKHRREISTQSIDEFVLQQVRQLNDTFPFYPGGIKYVFEEYLSLLPLESTLFYRYEDIIFYKEKWLTDMLTFLNVKLNNKVVTQIIQKYDVLPEKEEKDQHIRQVLPGNYKKHLHRDTIKQLNLHLLPILQAFNYDQVRNITKPCSSSMGIKNG